ncbi:hypothetical protein PINS_up002399 [Pythium insidiosum]|nr:hypothetical protein PINS_up002399 [Pythium insidiosum]
MLPPPVSRATLAISDYGELGRLLDDLLVDLNSDSDLVARRTLLLELAAAVTCHTTLQRLCFQDQSHLAATDGSTAVGLVSFLLHEVAPDPTAASLHTEQYLHYVVSGVRLLTRLFFGGQLIAERLRFFLSTSLERWCSALTSIPRIDKRHKTPEWTSLLEDLIDEQVALLHELVALQEEAAMLQNATYFQHHPSIATLLARRVVACSGTATSNDARWLARLVKRVAVAVSRAPKELPAADNKGGSTWSLTLWRNMTLLHAVLHADRRVGEVTLERTKDLIEYVWLARLLLLGLITRDVLA